MTTTKQTYELTINRTIDDELLDSIITTAVNGGINYWCYATVDSCQQVKLHPAASDVDFKPQSLTRAKVLMGLHRLCKEQYCNQRIYDYIMHAIADNDGAHIDADAADVIVQAALFDEIVYG